MEEADKDNSWATTRPPKSNSWKSLKKLKLPTSFSQLNAIISDSWISILLTMVPITVALSFANTNPTTIFAVNCIAIISLMALFGCAGQIVIHADQTIMGLLNTSFRFAYSATFRHFYRKATESAVPNTAPVKGSTPPNLPPAKDLTLSLGKHRFLSATIIRIAVSFLQLAISHPWPLWLFMNENATTIVVFSAIYCCCMIFQPMIRAVLHITKTDEYNETPTRLRRRCISNIGLSTELVTTRSTGAAQGRLCILTSEIYRLVEAMGEDAYWVLLSPEMALFASATVAAVTALCADLLPNKVSSFIPGIGDNFATTVRFILLPIFGNFAEHATAVSVAFRDRTDPLIGFSIRFVIHVAHKIGMRIPSITGPKILDLRKGLSRHEIIRRVYGLQTAIIIAATLRLRKLSFLRFIRSLVCNTRGRKFRCLMRRGAMQKYMHPLNNDRTTAWEDGGLSCPLQGSWFGLISMF